MACVLGLLAPAQHASAAAPHRVSIGNGSGHLHYADAQAKAIANGALPGFGKSQLGDPQLVEKIRAAATQRTGVA